MKHTKTTGYIIKRKNVGEADRLLTIFTKDEGKIQVRANGVRKITSKRASHIEPLNFVTLSLYKGQRGYTLTEVTTINSFEPLKTDLKKIGLLYHVCELLDGLCPENQENSAVFFLFQGFLENFQKEINLGGMIHNFELQLLKELGYYSEQDLTGNKASFFIESILERKLKARQILPHLL